MLSPAEAELAQHPPGLTDNREGRTVKSADLHGFNYDGSWGTSGLDLWVHHDSKAMAAEISLGKSYFPGWNVARWRLSHEAYQRGPRQFLDALESGLEIFSRNEILVIPVVFNRWRDPVCDWGGVALDHIVPGLSMWNRTDDLFTDIDTPPGKVASSELLFRAYLTDVVGEHAKDDRVHSWDLCNEPLMGPYLHDPGSAVRQAELRWLTWCYNICKALGARQPLTIGNYGDITALELTEPISDIISFHPYYMWNGSEALPHLTTKAGFEQLLDDAVALAGRARKELIANETVWGARDDAEHVEQLRYTLSELTKRHIGYVVHAVNHSLAADLHRDEYGPVGPPECLHFIEANGTLRRGHEAFNEFAPAGSPASH
jgi:hypothetical protein